MADRDDGFFPRPPGGGEQRDNNLFTFIFIVHYVMKLNEHGMINQEKGGHNSSVDKKVSDFSSFQR